MLKHMTGIGATAADLRQALTGSMERTRAGADRIANAFNDTEASFTDALCRDLGVRTAVAVGGTDPIGIATTHALLKAASLDAPAIRPLVLFNRADAHEAERGSELLREGLEHFLELPLALAGFLPFDARLAAAMAEGAALPAVLAESPLPGLGDALLTQLLATVTDR